MKILFLRLLFIIALVFFEFSFFDVLFPWTVAPMIIFISVITWSLLVPFPQVFFSVIPLTLLFDIVSSGAPGLFSLYAICLVYSTGFISRRISIKRGTIGIAISVVFSVLSLLGWRIFLFLFSGAEQSALLFFSFIFSRDTFLSMLFCLPIFVLVFSLISRFERYMHSVEQGDFSRVR